MQTFDYRLPMHIKMFQNLNKHNFLCNILGYGVGHLKRATKVVDISFVSHQLCRGEASHHFGSALSELLVTLSAALSQN